MLMFKKKLLYIFINYLMQGVNILLNLLFMKYLSGTHLGDLSLARTWQQLLDYSHAGTRFSLDRFIPTANPLQKEQFFSTVMIVTFVISFFLFLMSALISGFNSTIMVFSFIGLLLSTSNVLKAYLRADSQVGRMLTIVIVVQFIPIFFSTICYFLTKNLLIYLFTHLSLFVASCLVAGIVEKKNILNIFKNINSFTEVLKKIVKPSSLLFLNSLFVFLYMVIDRFFIDYYLGRTALGDYSIITFSFTALMIIPASFSELIFTKIVKESVVKRKKIYLKESFFSLCITLIGIILANLLMDFFISHYTKYSYLLALIHLATYAVLPFSLTAIYYHVLNGHDLRKNLLIVSFSVCLLQVFYFFVLNVISSLSIVNFLYAKLAFGWIILLGYFLNIMFFSKK